jgi:hypothetical protein
MIKEVWLISTCAVGDQYGISSEHPAQMDSHVPLLSVSVSVASSRYHLLGSLDSILRNAG